MSSAFTLKKRVERGDKRGGSKKEIKGRTCTASGFNTDTVWQKRHGGIYPSGHSSKKRPVELDVDRYEHDDKQPGGRPMSVYHERLFIAHVHPIQLAQSENHLRTSLNSTNFTLILKTAMKNPSQDDSEQKCREFICRKETNR